MNTSKLVVAGLVMAAAWLGLAAWGAGGITAFFAMPAHKVLVVVTVALVAATGFTEVNVSSGEQEDRGNRWVLVLAGVIGTLLGWLPAYCERQDIWIVGGDILRWIGVALFTAGGILRLWPVFVLGRRFSGLVAIQKGHTLVTDGIFGVVRNPSYLGLIVSMVGWGFAFRSVLGVVLAALFIPVLVGRIRSEERLLSGYFGEAYEAYRARTWRLVPYLY
jgi:protein-S-isoprenylcysteine O-methyltransferase Ste14